MSILVQSNIKALFSGRSQTFFPIIVYLGLTQAWELQQGRGAWSTYALCACPPQPLTRLSLVFLGLGRRARGEKWGRKHVTWLVWLLLPLVATERVPFPPFFVSLSLPPIYICIYTCVCIHIYICACNAMAPLWEGYIYFLPPLKNTYIHTYIRLYK